MGQSVAATHNYLLGHIFTLYPSPCGHPVRSHLFMFITRDPTFPWRMIDVFQEERGGTCALLLLQSWLRGGGGFPPHPYSDYESVTRHKRNNNSWWVYILKTKTKKTFRGRLLRLGGFRASWRVWLSGAPGGFVRRSSARPTFNHIRSL